MTPSHLGHYNIIIIFSETGTSESLLLASRRELYFIPKREESQEAACIAKKKSHDNILDNSSDTLENVEVESAMGHTFDIQKKLPEKKQKIGLDTIFTEWPLKKNHLLDAKWEKFCKQIFKIIERDVKEQSNLDIISKFKGSEFTSGKQNF
ncbi:hypothetical protein CVS40_10849 [Lucilia cuprina]|nr:hypothetical protein CVS40_10849 [Lucilia cuprina]